MKARGLWLCSILLIWISIACAEPVAEKIPEAVAAQISLDNGRSQLIENFSFVHGQDGMITRDYKTISNISRPTVLVAKLGRVYDELQKENQDCYLWIAANSFSGNFSEVWIVRGPKDRIAHYQITIPPMSDFRGEIKIDYIIWSKDENRPIGVEYIANGTFL